MIITQSVRQPSPQDRLSEFKAKAVYVPELNIVFNQFTQQFNKGDSYAEERRQ
jgi:hypothetical protein